jgi:hypothetical protein
VKVVRSASILGNTIEAAEVAADVATQAELDAAAAAASKLGRILYTRPEPTNLAAAVAFTTAKYFMVGGQGNDTTEGDVSIRCPYATTIRRIIWYLDANASSAGSVALRVDGADSAAVKALTGAGTGQVEITAGLPLAVAAGAMLAHRGTSTGGATVSAIYVEMDGPA